MRTILGALGTAVVIVALSVSPAQAFSNVKVGDKLVNAKLEKVGGGGARAFLGTATASVFVFFKPGARNSQLVLKQVAECQRLLQRKSVHWVAVAPGDASLSQIESDVKKAGLAMQVLLDKDDVLYGKLGVNLLPVVGIADKAHTLVAYQPFSKVNFRDALLARVRYTLGEISKADLDRALAPPRSRHNTKTAAARRNLKLATMLHKSGKLDKALHYVDEALEKCPKMAAAHALRGQILAAQKKCPQALASFDKALAIDPGNRAATAGKKRCAK